MTLRTSPRRPRPVSPEDAVLTHTQLLPGAVQREESEREGTQAAKNPPGVASRRPGAQPLSFTDVKGPSPSWIWAPAEPRERGSGQRVEHLEQQLARSPAVYHRKGRKTRTSRRP